VSKQSQLPPLDGGSDSDERARLEALAEKVIGAAY
jgi:hypothetical protein